MQTHVIAIAELCLYYFRNICRRLSDEECKIIGHAYVISWLNYSIVPLYSLITQPYRSCNEFKTMQFMY